MEGVDPGMATLGLAFLAGLVTTLSPCVLPILPLAVASASGRSRWGIVFLAAGLALSFTGIGLILASAGQMLGLEEHTLRMLAGVLMLAVGAVLLFARLQALLTQGLTGFGQFGGRRLSTMTSEHPLAQFAVGALLGVAWAPCVGPTLGAAIALASTGEHLLESAVTMLVFGVAAALPLIGIGLGSRAVFLRQRERLMRVGVLTRRWMGFALIFVGALVVTGLDKMFETAAVTLMPEWLLNLTTNF